MNKFNNDDIEHTIKRVLWHMQELFALDEEFSIDEHMYSDTLGEISYLSLVERLCNTLDERLREDSRLTYVGKYVKFIGIEGCDFTGKTTLVNRLKDDGYNTVKQPSQKTALINKLVDFRNNVKNKNSKDMYKLVDLMIRLCFELDRVQIMCNIHDTLVSKIDSGRPLSPSDFLYISDRTSMSNFLCDATLANIIHVPLDDRVMYFFGLKRYTTMEKVYRRVYKTILNVANNFNYTTICMSNLLTKHRLAIIQDKWMGVKDIKREETVPGMDIAQTWYEFLEVNNSQLNTMKNIQDNRKLRRIFDIVFLNTTPFMDGDENYKEVLDVIKKHS